MHNAQMVIAIVWMTLTHTSHHLAILIGLSTRIEIEDFIDTLQKTKK